MAGQVTRALVAAFLIVAASLAAYQVPSPASPAIYLNPDLPTEQRAKDLVSRMTLAQKLRHMQNNAAALPELNVSAYEWWNEALHGVARAGQATVFPQAIALAATFDYSLVQRLGTVLPHQA